MFQRPPETFVETIVETFVKILVETFVETNRWNILPNRWNILGQNVSTIGQKVSTIVSTKCFNKMFQRWHSNNLSMFVYKKNKCILKKKKKKKTKHLDLLIFHY